MHAWHTKKVVHARDSRKELNTNSSHILGGEKIVFLLLLYIYNIITTIIKFLFLLYINISQCTACLVTDRMKHTARHLSRKLPIIYYMIQNISGKWHVLSGWKLHVHVLHVWMFWVSYKTQVEDRISYQVGKHASMFFHFSGSKCKTWETRESWVCHSLLVRLIIYYFYIINILIFIF